MNYDQEMLSDDGLRALALHITRATIDTVPSKHDAEDDYEFATLYGAMPTETYYKLLSEAHQRMIAAGLTREKRGRVLVRSGNRIIALQIPIAEKAFLEMSESAKSRKH